MISDKDRVRIVNCLICGNKLEVVSYEIEESTHGDDREDKVNKWCSRCGTLVFNRVGYPDSIKWNIPFVKKLMCPIVGTVNRVYLYIRKLKV